MEHGCTCVYCSLLFVPYKLQTELLHTATIVANNIYVMNHG